MFRFFLFLLVASLLAAGATYYWKTYHPEGPVISITADSKSAAPGSSEVPPTTGTNRSLSDRSSKVTLPSDMQNMASLVTVISSLLSGLGAMISAYFSWAHYRATRVAVRSED